MICIVAAYVGLATGLSYTIYWILKRILRRDYKIKKILGKRKRDIPRIRMIGTFSNQLSPIVGAFYNKEKVRYKLIRSGGTFSHLGINDDNFISFEVLFTAVIAAIMILTKSSVAELILYPVIAITFIELVIKTNTEARQKKIRKRLDVLIASTRDYLTQGMDMKDVFMMLPSKIEEGPLKEELLLLQSNLGLMKLNENVDNQLAEFAKRIGLEEIDNYILALSQSEMTGRVTRMLDKQLALLRTQKNSRVQRETKQKEKLSSLASIMVVIMTLAVIMVPMFIFILQNKLFNR